MRNQYVDYVNHYFLNYVCCMLKDYFKSIPNFLTLCDRLMEENSLLLYRDARGSEIFHVNFR